jgi:hypothetical protein
MPRETAELSGMMIAAISGFMCPAIENAMAVKL